MSLWYSFSHLANKRKSTIDTSCSKSDGPNIIYLSKNKFTQQTDSLLSCKEKITPRRRKRVYKRSKWRWVWFFILKIHYWKKRHLFSRTTLGNMPNQWKKVQLLIGRRSAGENLTKIWVEPSDVEIRHKTT